MEGLVSAQMSNKFYIVLTELSLFVFDISSTQHLTIWAGNDLSSPPTKELHGLRVPSKFCVTRWGNKD